MMFSIRHKFLGSVRKKVILLGTVMPMLAATPAMAQSPDSVCPTVQDESLGSAALVACEVILDGSCADRASQLARGFLGWAWQNIRTRLNDRMDEISERLTPVPEVSALESNCQVTTAGNAQGGHSNATGPVLSTIIHHVFAIDRFGQYRQMPPSHVFNAGDRFVLTAGVNLPGILDVYHIAPNGAVKNIPEDSAFFDAPGTAILPNDQIWVFDDEAGDETIQLQFYPCRGASAVVLPPEEALMRQNRNSVDQIAEGLVRPEVEDALRECRSILGQRQYIDLVQDNRDEGLARENASFTMHVRSDPYEPVVARIVLKN